MYTKEAAVNLVLAHKSIHPGTLEKRHGADHEVVDLTSKGPEPWVRFSPFYPHGEIPVPGLSGVRAASVEGLWQGLKVFETAGVDLRKLEVTTMRGLKRTVRRFGRCLGHAFGPEERLLGYLEARFQLYLPAYLWVLENRLQAEVAALRERAEAGTVVVLDYEVNADPEDLRRPLSHAGLVIRYLEGRWPESREAAPAAS
jgi:hypothetical protein